MKKFLPLFLMIFMISCSVNNETKILVYAWESGPGKLTDKELLSRFKDYNKKGIDGLMYSAGQDPETYKRVGSIAKIAGLEFHAWIPALVQSINERLDYDLYAVNGLGESAWDKPDPENHGLVPGELEAAIIESMDNGAAGICLFTPGRMTDKDWVVLKKFIYR
ncbi:MAG: hypothetical protein K8R35_01415 [Bacteroidales bacterium]|nr:hypothetical protein [Bacteroidales bacterium]